MGYRFLKKAWGKGYATETAKAWVKYAFEELKVDKLFAITDLEHENSKKVLTKVGFQEIEVIHYKGEDVNWLEVTKEKYKSYE